MEAQSSTEEIWL